MSTKKRAPGRFRKLDESKIEAADPKLLKQIRLDDEQGLFVPADLNPHGFVPQWKAVCYTCDISLSLSWRDRRSEAVADERPHLHLYHWTDIVPRYTR